MLGHDTEVNPQVLIPQILSAYEQTGKNVSLNQEEKEALTTVLSSVAQFSKMVGMYDVFKRYNLRIVYILHHGPSLMEWMAPTGRYSPHIKHAIILTLLIEAIAQKEPTQLRVDQIEEIILKHISRDRSLSAALICMAKILNDLQDNDVVVNFKADHFDIDEPLIPEVAMLSTLATFRMLKTIIPNKPTVVDSTKTIFKLFYIYYTDLQSSLNYNDFLDQHVQFLSQHADNPKLTKFYFGFYQRICEQLKVLDIMDSGNFYTTYNIHPFNLVDNLDSLIASFCSKVEEKNDYATNLEQYIKDFKDIVSYVWVEINEVYLLTLTYDSEATIEIQKIKELAEKVFLAVLACYHDTRVVPKKSILTFFKPGRSLENAGSAAVDKFVDQFFSIAQKTIEQLNNPMLDMVKNERTQSMIKMGIKNFNVNKILDNRFVKKYVKLNFNFISKGLLYFWQTFAKSSDFKTLAEKGDSQAIMTNILGALHDPAAKQVRNWLDKTPYGAMVNLPGIGKAVDGVLGKAKSTLTRTGTSSDPVFNTGAQVVNDLARISSDQNA